MMTYPRITVDQEKLLYNLNTLADALEARGFTMAAVVKCACADPLVVEAANRSRAAQIADSRLSNLARAHTEKPRMLLRIAMPSEVEALVETCEISQQSEIETIRLLARAMEKKRIEIPHRVVLMLDLGDLREGVFIRDEAAILQAAEAILKEPTLEFYGVGANLSCFGGVLPDPDNMAALAACAKALRARYGIELPLVSGGATSSLHMALAGEMPPEINHLRIGEGFLVGHDTSSNCNLPGLFADAFTLSAQIVEVQQKPSRPFGRMGVNAFGEAVSFPDRGIRRRGILALGRQDTKPEGLTPRDAKVEILGASSDHLLVDLEDTAYRLGDILDFDLDYGALLHAYTSGYVHR